MKATKYVLVAAGIVAVLAAIAWFLRDSLIQRISNPLLDDYGISVTDVSLDALATSDASIGYLELVHDKGTTITIEDLTLPFGTTPKETKTYTAKKVTIVTATRMDGELFELAQLINQFISLPDNLSDSEVAVAEFSLPPYPPVYDLLWELADGEQRLRGSIDSNLLSLTITRSDAINHNVVLSLARGSAPLPGHFVAAILQQGDHGILINGTSSIDLPTWEPVAKLSGIILPEIEITSGTATLQFDVKIPDDATRSPTLASNFTPTAPLWFTYTGTAGDIASILVESASPVEIAATFADIDWSLQQTQASLRVNYGEWRDVPLTVSNLSCQSGPACSMETQVTMDAAELSLGNIGRLEFVSAENVLFPDAGVSINVQPGASLNMKGLAVSDTTIDRIEAQLVSSASLELLGTGWQLAADSLDARIQSVAVSDNVSVTAPLFLENVRVSELDGSLSASSGVYAPSSQAIMNEQSVALPGFKGGISLQDNKVSIDLAPVGLYRDGIVAAKHDIDSHAGSLTVSDVAVSFGKKSLSDRISPWPNDRDLIAGTVALELDTNWTQKESGFELDAQASIDAADLAGYYADTAFTGLSTRVNVAYRNPTGIVAEPSTINIALIDTGLPVENLSAAYTLDLNAMSVDVDDLRMMALGGSVWADPFSFRTERERNTLTLRAESIDLTELLSLNEFEAIEVSGSIGATLPVTIEGDIVTIEDGTMTGDPAGGIIRYKPLKPPDESDASAIGLASRALSNFEFDTLSSDINLTNEGDLILKLRLTGRNPTLDEKRPVVLNLGVENNIPQMLKSLRAARAVEEILEKRLNQ